MTTDNVSRIAPLDPSLSTIRFEDIFDLKEIQRIQDAFSAATGVASLITDIDGQPLTRPSNFCHLCNGIIRKTELGRQNCFHSDAILGRQNTTGPTLQPCLSGGLWDGGTSICVGSRHIANWLIGQVLEEPVDRDSMAAYARKIGANEAEFLAALDDVPRMSRAKFEEICKALYLIANQLSRLAIQNVQQTRMIDEIKAAENTRLQLEEQLRHAQKMEAMGRLAGGIAHDFNNLLTVILGNMDLLKEQVVQLPEAHTLSVEVIEAARRAAELTRQLLTFSRHQVMNFQYIALNDVISRLTKMLGRLLGENIALLCDLGADLPPVNADASMLEQIVVNLAVNARDAMPNGGRLTIGTKLETIDRPPAKNPAARPGRYVSVSVVDTGHGMDEATLSRLFEPFFTTKDIGKGTGLGLAMIYGIAKQHGGWIDVASAPNAGSKFKVYFPALQDTDAIAEHESAPPIVLTGTETILLVEDEPAVRQLIHNSLAKQGYTVLDAAHGIAAIELFKQQPDKIDLLLSDMMMPMGIRGDELALKLREYRPDLKVILMSGYSRALAESEQPLVPDSLFLPKPFAPHKVFQAVRHILDAN